MPRMILQLATIANTWTSYNLLCHELWNQWPWFLVWSSHISTVKDRQQTKYYSSLHDFHKYKLHKGGCAMGGEQSGCDTVLVVSGRSFSLVGLCNLRTEEWEWVSKCGRKRASLQKEQQVLRSRGRIQYGTHELKRRRKKKQQYDLVDGENHSNHSPLTIMWPWASHWSFLSEIFFLRNLRVALEFVIKCLLKLNHLNYPLCKLKKKVKCQPINIAERDIILKDILPIL